jgi:hypothetical protein
MCYLTTVVGSFHGRVLAARLGAEGVLVVLKGTTDGPYPLPSAVDVLVPADQLQLAREILLADAIDDAFGQMELDALPEEQGSKATAGFDEVVWSSDALTALPRGEPSDTFSCSSGSERERHRPPRVRGLPAVLVVLLVGTMIAAALAAVLAH